MAAVLPANLTSRDIDRLLREQVGRTGGTRADGRQWVGACDQDLEARHGEDKQVHECGSHVCTVRRSSATVAYG